MPLQYNYSMNEDKALFPSARDTEATVVKQERVTPENGSNGMKSVFSPLAPPFQSRVTNEVLTYMSQQEPREADTAPISNDLDDVFANLRLNTDLAYDDIEYNPQQYFSATKAEPMPASQPNIWSEGGSPPAKNGDSIDTFDFLIKSLSSANNFISMLSREQLSVMQAIRPRVLYDFLLEVARVRTDKRLRRALPNECAFCKNNGENEEHYSSHSLKDWRGRVLCPVLRAFRCPRCGATGDRAHTIKYCPEPSESSLDRSGSFLYRRRVSSASSVLLSANGRAQNYTGSPSSTTVPSPSTNLNSSMWSNFVIN